VSNTYSASTIDQSSGSHQPIGETPWVGAFPTLDIGYDPADKKGLCEGESDEAYAWQDSQCHGEFVSIQHCIQQGPVATMFMVSPCSLQLVQDPTRSKFVVDVVQVSHA
jgi:hypothetical protein